MVLQPPNYTQTPNICFDEIFKTLKEGELRVILVIIRQTFGWHKSFDRISLSKIAEKSGLERSRVCKSLNSLIEKGLVQKKKFGDKGKERCYFSLAINFTLDEKEDDENDDISEEEMDLISNNSYQCPKDTPPVSERHHPQCPKDTTPSVLKTPTKETYSKETKEKKQQQNKDDVAAADQKSDLNANTEKTFSTESIEYTTPGGKKKICSSSEIYSHFIKKNYQTTTIQKAIKRVQEKKEPIGNVLKLLEIICEEIENGASCTLKKSQIEEKNMPPKNISPRNGGNNFNWGKLTMKETK